MNTNAQRTRDCIYVYKKRIYKKNIIFHAICIYYLNIHQQAKAQTSVPEDFDRDDAFLRWPLQ